MRRYVIGDVHGCIDELLELEHILMQDSKDCFFIFTGDLIDRGKDSIAVVEHLITLQQSNQAASVLGNHDEMLLQVYVASTGKELPYTNIGTPDKTQLRMLQQHWYLQGGYDTLQSYTCNLQSMETIPATHIQFLSSLPLLWYDDDIIVTHANASKTSILNTMKAPNNIPRDEYIRQSLLWERTMPDERVDLRRIHISGHTPLQTVYINTELGIIMLDTGCVYGNMLSAYCVETGAVFSVDCKNKNV